MTPAARWAIAVALLTAGGAPAWAAKETAPAAKKGARAARETGVLIQAISREELGQVVRQVGYVPELGTDKNGNPLVRFALEGYKSVAILTGCEAGRCRSYQFMAGFTMKEKPAAAKINEWNLKGRYGRAYTDGEGLPYVQMDVSLKGGVAPRHLEETVRIWHDVLVAFTRHMR